LDKIIGRSIEADGRNRNHRPYYRTAGEGEGWVMDYIVTTPKSEMANSAREAADCIRDGRGFYLRKLPPQSYRITPGESRLFYVEDGYVRGFGIIEDIWSGQFLCETTGRGWGRGNYAVVNCHSWKWIKPIPMRGFQGWRQMTLPFEVIGGWLDPKPRAN
jgi:hypothetical protein